MRNLYLFITVLSLSISCKSVDKMIEKGNYEEALEYAASKMRGKKQKPHKYVVAFERAYRKYMDQQDRKIASIQAIDRLNSYEQLYNIYARMDRLQEMIIPLLPITSDQYYTADISIVDYSDQIKQAADAASERLYRLAVNQLEESKAGNKLMARESYYNFSRINKYNDFYKNSKELQQLAQQLGTVLIGVATKSSPANVPAQTLLDHIQQMNYNAYSTNWTKYALASSSRIYDFQLTIYIDEIAPYREREIIKTEQFSKEVDTGTQRKVRDHKGKPLKDSTGQFIFEKVFEIVTADVRTHTLEKVAAMTGRIVATDPSTAGTISTTPLDVTYLFSDYQSDYRGDERALPTNVRKGLKPASTSYPTDYDMTQFLAKVLQKEIHDVFANQSTREIAGF